MNRLFFSTMFSLLAIIHDVRRLGIIKKTLILLGKLGLFLAVVWSPSFADTPVDLMKKVNDRWQQDVKPKQRCRWNDSAYQIGNLATYRTIRDMDYREYSETYAGETCNWEFGRKEECLGEEKTLITHPDDQAAGNIFLELFAEPTSKVEEVNLKHLFKSLHERMDEPLDSPETEAKRGEDCVYEWKAVDWIFMAGPVFSKLGKLCAEEDLSDDLRSLCDGEEENNVTPYKVTKQRNPYWDTMFKLYEHAKELQSYYFSPIGKRYCDPGNKVEDSSGLWFRDVGRRVKEPGKAGSDEACELVWGRGNGWVMAAIPRMLEHLPADYPGKFPFHRKGVEANRSQTNNDPQNTIDNNLATRWSCKSKDNPKDYCYITFDLESVVDVEGVEIAWYNGDLRKAKYGLEISEDGIIWETVIPDFTESSGNTVQTERVDEEKWGSARQVRYIRYRGQGNSKNNWNSITEFNAIGREIHPQFTDVLKQMALALKALQRDDGFWPPALFDEIREPEDKTGSYSPETSGTAFFTYAIAWGINNGYLDHETYLPIVTKAWEGLVQNAVTSEGKLGYIQDVGAEPPEKPVNENDTAEADRDRLYGIGAFLLAGSEVAKAVPTIKPSVTASEYEDRSDRFREDPNIPEHTLDNGLKTRWSAFGEGQWIAYDLGERRTPGVMEIAWYKGKNRKAIFKVEACDANNLEDCKWETVFPETMSSGTTDDLEDYTLQPVEGRYVRVVGRGNTDNKWNSITEVKISCNEEPVDCTPSRFGVVIASSFQADNVPGNTLDNELGTRWSARGKGQWIAYDLGSVKTIGGVEIAWYRGDKRVAAFDFEVCTDNNFDVCDMEMKWKQVITNRPSNGNTLDLESYNFDDSETEKAHYVKIVGQGNTENVWNSITEVKIKSP